MTRQASEHHSFTAAAALRDAIGALGKTDTAS
jgi:hypothetical protein